MRGHFLVLSLFVISVSSFGTHIVGGDLSYQFKENLPFQHARYLIDLTLIRDVYKSEVEFDTIVEIGVYDKSTRKRVNIISMALGKTRQNNMSCISEVHLHMDFQRGNYQKTIDLPRNTSGYILTWERCCRSWTENLTLGSNGDPETPLHLRCEIPPNTIKNNSAAFKNIVRGFCVGRTSSWVTSNYDIDGDSVVVTLAPPIKGMASIGYLTSKPSPFDTLSSDAPISYKSSFHYLAPFGTNSENIARIRSGNNLEIRIMKPGFYTVAFEIAEYRGGEMITSRIVDVIALALPCPDPVPTNAPLDLSATYYEYLKTKLEWKTCDNQVDHSVVYRKKSGGQYDSIGYVPRGYDSYVDSSISSIGQYFYYVEGVGLSGFNSGASGVDSIRFHNLGTESYTMNEMTIYPNPVRNVLHLSLNHVMSSISIYDLAGSKVIEVGKTNPNGTEISLHLESLKPGMYSMLIRGNGEISHGRFIKQK